MDLRAKLALVKDHPRQASVAAGFVTLVVILICVLSTGPSTDYQSIALLMYSGNAVATLGAPPLSAVQAASTRLDNPHLLDVMDHFALYPKLRQKSADEAVAYMRSRTTLTQPDPYSLQVGFRDDNSDRSQQVTNALAEILESYVVTPAVATGNQHPSTYTGESKDKLQKRIAWIGARLDELAKSQTDLQAESAEKREKIIAITNRRPEPANTAEPAPVVDPNSETRAQLKDQLAAEKQHLATLRVRYTDAYPDVQQSRDLITQLETKLAALPPPPPPRPRNAHTPYLYQKQLDDLTAGESKLGELLRSNEKEIAGLQHRTAELKAEMLTAPDSNLTTPLPLAKSSPSTVKSRGLAAITTPVKPFRILQTATMSVVVGTVPRSYGTIFVSFGIATLVLLGIYFAPLFPTRDSLILTAADMRKSLPAHVIYLGDISRIEIRRIGP